MSKISTSEPGATYSVVRARKDRWCGDGSATYPLPCPRKIAAGEQYVRAVMFANHDVYSYVDRDTHAPITRPMVTDLCFECANHYHTTSLLVIDAQRAAERARRATTPTDERTDDDE